MLELEFDFEADPESLEAGLDSADVLLLSPVDPPLLGLSLDPLEAGLEA